MEEKNPRKQMLFVDGKKQASLQAESSQASPVDVSDSIHNFDILRAESEEEARRVLTNQKDIELLVFSDGIDAIDTYDICAKLKDDPTANDISVMFMSSEDSIEAKISQYQSGAIDYIIKPSKPICLKERIAHEITRRQTESKMLQDLEIANSTAMCAIMSAGEQGTVIDFLRQSFHVEDLQKLADLVVDTTMRLELKSTVLVSTPWSEIVSSPYNEIPPLEIELLKRTKDGPRLLQRNNRLIIQFENVSQFIRNMPEDEDKAGRIRDHLALILEGANDRAKSLILSEHINDLLKESYKSLEIMQQKQMEYKFSTMEIINPLLEQVQQSFLAYGLTEQQEVLLLDLVTRVVDRSIENFDKSLEVDDEMRHIIDKINKLALKL